MEGEEIEKEDGGRGGGSQGMGEGEEGVVDAGLWSL